VLDALLPAVHRAGVEPAVPDGVELLVGDVRDAATVCRALHGVDAVCHQAAMVGLGVDVQDMPEYAGINALGTAVLLAAMARADVGRLVLASSMVVYGEGRYACAEHGVVPAAPRRRPDLDDGRFEPPSTGGGAIALRYHNVYGPSMPRDTPYAGVAAIFRSALEAGRAPRVFEDGGQQRDFVHVTDVAEANVRALQADPPESGLRAYNIASGWPHTVGDMARTLAAAFGGPEPVVTGEYRVGDVRHVVASPERAADELGFRARVSFEDGVRAFATDPLRPAP
jgi:dTDP-L-rhamnose 4-epimerase